MNELTHLSLFSGIGGLDLAGEWAGFKTVGQCEWADYPRKVLEKHWPGLPRWRDIRTFTKESFYEQTGLESVTVLSGGFPCQPFSTAGKRRGKEDDRYLWPEMLRVIQEIRPHWVFGENVAGIVSMELDMVLSDLESIGYTCQAFVIPACAVDAPHRRDRCAIVANSMCVGGQTRSANPQRRKERNADQPFYGGASLADAQGERCREKGGGIEQSQKWLAGCGQIVPNSNSTGFQKSGYKPEVQKVQPENRITLGDRWPTEPDVGRVANGVPYRVDRLRCLGNAVVPQWAFQIFSAIAELEAHYA